MEKLIYILFFTFILSGNHENSLPVEADIVKYSKNNIHKYFEYQEFKIHKENNSITIFAEDNIYFAKISSNELKLIDSLELAQNPIKLSKKSLSEIYRLVTESSNQSK